jgi:hypothetical protein
MSKHLDTSHMNAAYAKLVRKKSGSEDARVSKLVLKGIPGGVWADYWATAQEEKGRSFSGQNLMDVAPKVPGWANKWAKVVADSIVAANPWTHSLGHLYLHVKQNGYPYDEEHFGYHLGMQAAGHGVSWSDDCKLPHSTIKIPSREFYR